MPKVATPVTGACQVYQTDLPPTFPAWRGSPASKVAFRFWPAMVPLRPNRLTRVGKLSAPERVVRASVRSEGKGPTAPRLFCTTTEERRPLATAEAGGADRGIVRGRVCERLERAV